MMIKKLEAPWQHICLLLAMLFLLSSFQLELSEATNKNVGMQERKMGNNGMRKRLDDIIFSRKRRAPSSPPSPMRNIGFHTRSAPMHPPILRKPFEPSQQPVTPPPSATNQQAVPPPSPPSS